MRVLNLYAGVGGNRYLWKNVEVTAVEMNPKIAKVYSNQFPDDELVIGDAHQYLLDHSDEFDFIWSSPPCPTHSRMMKATRHRLRFYPDMKLYEEILFLTHFYEGKWVVENVVPYYKPLIKPSGSIGRHLFWGNVEIPEVTLPLKNNFIKTATVGGRQVLFDWLEMEPFDEIVYLPNSHDPCRMLRNCVHPRIGEGFMSLIG